MKIVQSSLIVIFVLAFALATADYTCGDTVNISGTSGELDLNISIPSSQNVTISVCNNSNVNFTIIGFPPPATPTCQITQSLSGSITLNLTIGAFGQFPLNITCSECDSDLTPNPNGTRGTCGAKTPIGNNCTETCDAGFYSIATLNRFCGSSAILSTSTANCVDILCDGSQQMPNHAHILTGCTDQDAYGSNCTYECDTGFYVTSGAAVRLCNLTASGNYSKSFLKCDAITCDGRNIPSNTVSVYGCTKNDPYDSNCTLACKEGYYLSSGDTVRICNQSSAGPYPSSTLQCLAITCNGTDIPLNTQIKSGCTSTDAFNRTCVLQCISGYYATSGTVSRVCDLTEPGPYPSSDLTCEPITCNGTDVPLNAHTVTACTDSDSYGSQCTLQCDEGYYNTSGKSPYTRTCDLSATGSYPTSNLTCTRITCNGTKLPLHSHVVGEYCNATDDYGANCTVDCDTGFQVITGQTTYTCTKPGLVPFNLICVDVDECINNTDCDILSKCYNTVGSWGCLDCPDGFTGDGKICNETDECLDSHTCDVQSVCVNTFGSYSCVPSIGKLSGVSGSGLSLESELIGTPLHAAVSPRQNVSILGVWVGGPVSGSGECGEWYSTLPQLSYPVTDYNISTEILSFIIPSGTGPCLFVTIEVKLFDSLYNATVMEAKNFTSPPSVMYITSNGNNWFGYILPSLQPYTLRRAGQPFGFPQLNIETPDDLTNYTGDLIEFDGVNFFEDARYPDHLEVFYGQNSNLTYRCDVQYDHPNASSHSIVCRTDPQSTGSRNFISLKFKYFNYTVSGYDSLNFGAFPKIASISGCTNNECPTEGGPRMTITGTNFEPQFTVYVGGILCDSLEANSGESYDQLDNVTGLRAIYCKLPAGVGTNLAVTVTSATKTQTSEDVTVSYAQPILYYVNGTTCINNYPSVEQCSRAGGMLTITGENFGKSGAVVLVGSYQCQNATYAVPHKVIICNFPYGTSLAQPVTVILSSQFSEGAVQVSYRQCPAGTYQVHRNPTISTVCADCGVGSFTSNLGMETCDQCEAGKFTNINGSSQCTPCPNGTWAPTAGATQCQNCSVGTFRASSSADLFCRDCQPLTYANETGHSECTPCPAGKESNSRASVCTDCQPGYFRAAGSTSYCTPCEAGKYVNASGRSRCDDCEGGTFALESGQSSCEACPIGKYIAGNDTSKCQPCPPRTYNAKEASYDCYPCQDGLVCNGGIATTMDDYWSFLSNSTGQYLVVACPPGICRNGGCAANRLAADINPLCGKCHEGYSEWSGVCTPCEKDNAAVIFGLFIASFAYVTLLHKVSQGKSTVPLKVLSYFVAVSRYIVPPRYGVSWLAFFDFSFFTSTSSTCVAPLAPYEKLWLDLATPLILFGELLILASIWICYRKFLFHYHGQAYFRDWREKYTPFVRTTISLTIFSYSHCVRICFDYLTCVHAGDSLVVFSNPVLLCDSDQYHASTGGIVFVLLIFLGLVPGFFLSHLCCKRSLMARYELNKELHIESKSLNKVKEHHHKYDKRFKRLQKCCRYMFYFEFGIPGRKAGENIGKERRESVIAELADSALKYRKGTASENLLEVDSSNTGCIRCSNSCGESCKKNCNSCYQFFWPKQWNSQDPDFDPVIWMLPLFSGYNDNVFWWEIWMLIRRTLILAIGTIFAEDQLYRGQAFVIVNGFILFTHIVGAPFREQEINIMESASLVVLIVLSTLVLDAPPILPVTNSAFVLLFTAGTFAIFAVMTFLFEFDQVLRGLITFSSFFRCRCCKTCYGGRWAWCCLCPKVVALREKRDLEKALKRMQLVEKQKGQFNRNTEKIEMNNYAGETDSDDYRLQTPFKKEQKDGYQQVNSTPSHAQDTELMSPTGDVSGGEFDGPTGPSSPSKLSLIGNQMSVNLPAASQEDLPKMRTTSTLLSPTTEQEMPKSEAS